MRVPPSSPHSPTDRPRGGGRGPVVIDTGVFGAELVPGSRLAPRYEPLITGRPAFICFQTVAELHFGALRRNWGAARMRKLDARIGKAEVVHSGPELVLTEAHLRVSCERAGHALGQSEHTADRWIAATALRLGIPVVADDGIFANVPGLILLTMPEA
jgi:predicted nucleic acid-binding protein